MDDFMKVLAFAVALYSACSSAKKAWQLGTELFG